MDTAPITTWEGAEAYFTWAHAPTMLYLSLALMVVVVVGTIVQSARHETKSFARADKRP